MKGRTYLAALAALAVGVGVSPAERGSATAVETAQDAKAKRGVVSPRPGQVVRSHHVRLRVRARGLSGVLRARLNGVAVGDDFGPPRRGVRVLRASISHGLRRGRNVLRVRVRRLGRWTRLSVVRFVVRTTGSLVGAGRDRRVVVGELVTLGGRIVQPRHRRQRSRVRWRLMKRTPGAPGARSSASASRSRAGLSRRATVGAHFRATRRGRYILRLTHRSGRPARSDSVTLTAVPPNPLVGVHTMAGTAGKPGIQVGNTTYPATVPSGNPAAFVQVLVLHRSSLGFDSNTTYTNTDQLAAALGKLDPSRLALVAHPKPADGSAPLAGSKGLLAALAPIGVEGGAGAGSVSAIGVKGLAAGDANVFVDPQGGGMDGYLTPDQNLNYGFVSPERVPYDFHSRPTRCAEDAGGDDDVGFRVSYMDPYTLACTVRLFSTNGLNLSDAQRDQAARQMGAHVDAIPEGALVRIEPMRTAKDVSRPLVGAIDRDTAVNLAAIVTGAGGTRHGFNTAVFAAAPASRPFALTYALMGWARAGEGNGEEVAVGVDGAEEASDHSGVLRRDRDYRFRPLQSSPSGSVPQVLQELILRPPTNAWPLDDNPGAHDALAYISQTADNRLGCNPRSAYWTQRLTESDLTAITATVRAATYPGAGASDPCTNGTIKFTAAEFATARTQLVTELGWVGRVRSYMLSLSSPFADGGVKSWSTVIDIAAGIYDESRKPDEDVALEWTEFTSLILEVLGPFTGEVSGEAADILDLGMWIAGRGADGSPAGEELPFAANVLGAKLADQAQQAQATYLTMGNIIVSDYAKLSVVGANGGCDPDSKGCDKSFSYTDADNAKVSAAIARGAERLAYEKLLPLGFHVFELAPSLRNVVDHSHPPDPRQYECGGGYHPWYDYPPSTEAWTSLLQGFDPVHHDNAYDVFVLSVPPGPNTYHGTPPEEKTLKRMFDPVSSSNAAADGGLGISPSELMRTAEHDGWTGNGPGQDSCTLNG
jgi:hypothetical protein